MFDTRLNSESHFFVSGQQLSGVESLDIGYNNSASILNPLGFPSGVTSISGPTNQTVSFSRNLIYSDPILNYTGSHPISGSLNYNGSAYGFRSGYLNSYSVNCAVGSIPKVNTSITVYDEMASGIDMSGDITTQLSIPRQGSISATCDNSTTNRVVGFDYSLTVNRKPYYTIGSETPVEVKLIRPINYTASVQLEVDNAFLESGYAFLGTGKNNRTVNFTINGRGGTTLQSLSIPNACLVGEQINTSADGAIRLTLNYMGHR
jgi:hypothetical protein